MNRTNIFSTIRVSLEIPWNFSNVKFIYKNIHHLIKDFMYVKAISTELDTKTFDTKRVSLDFRGKYQCEYYISNI